MPCSADNPSVNYRLKPKAAAADFSSRRHLSVGYHLVKGAQAQSCPRGKLFA
jgi:hypothetical protein